MSLECISLFKYFEICTCYVEETGEELTLSKCSGNLKPETSDQPDRETCALKCHYL